MNRNKKQKIENASNKKRGKKGMIITVCEIILRNIPL